MLTHHAAHPPLWHPDRSWSRTSGSPAVRDHHFPSARSLSIALSNSASANSFFNWAFSTRNSLSSFTSAAFILP